MKEEEREVCIQYTVGKVGCQPFTLKSSYLSKASYDDVNKVSNKSWRIILYFSLRFKMSSRQFWSSWLVNFGYIVWRPRILLTPMPLALTLPLPMPPPLAPLCTCPCTCLCTCLWLCPCIFICLKATETKTRWTEWRNLEINFTSDNRYIDVWDMRFQNGNLVGGLLHKHA